MLAAEQQHDKAINYIKNTIFPSEYYLFLANSYEKGEKVSKDKDKALYFYEKAVAEKNNEAAFRLGRLNQCNNEEKAFDYFVKAARCGHAEALCYLERLAHEMNPDKQLQLFNLYRTLPFNDRHKALYWCRQAIQSSNLQGLELSTEHIKLLFEAKQSINFQQLSQIFKPSMQQESKGSLSLFK